MAEPLLLAVHEAELELGFGRDKPGHWGIVPERRKLDVRRYHALWRSWRQQVARRGCCGEEAGRGADAGVVVVVLLRVQEGVEVARIGGHCCQEAEKIARDYIARPSQTVRIFPCISL